MNDFLHRSTAGTGSSFLLVSTHDYRSRRKASVHFIVRELAKLGTTRFFSPGFSVLSLVKRDPRAALWSRANRIETVDSVECYLWRTPLHPINLRRAAFDGLERRAFDAYKRLLPRVFEHWVRDADTIIVESGLAVSLVDVLRRLNPRARLIYLCSDALQTIGCSAHLTRELQRFAALFDDVIVPSPQLAGEFPADVRTRFVPHGMEAASQNAIASPYAGGVNLVSVGSMLFDRTFFEMAAAACPDLTFHVIGGGKHAVGLAAPNIKLQGEMPFAETLAYITHADVGIAPYQGDKVAGYLVDTSMKLMQYQAYGLPAVCPSVIAGGKTGRFGYIPGNRDSIVGAIAAARRFGRFEGKAPLSWAEVTGRILSSGQQSTEPS